MDAVAEAVSNLLAHESIAGQVLAAHWEQQDFYEYVDPKVAAEIGAATRVNLTALLDCLTSNGPLAGEVVQWLDTVGRRGFLHGVPLDAIVAAYQVGAHIVSEPLFNELVSLVADPERRATLVAATTVRLLDLTSRACEIVTAAYKDAQQASDGPTVGAVLLEQLLGNDHDDAAEASAVPDQIPAGPYAVLVLVSLDGHPAALGDLRDRLPTAVVTGMLWDPLPHRVVLVPQDDVDTDALGRWARAATLCVVVTATSPGLAGITRVYRGLRRRLSVVPDAGRAGLLRPTDLMGSWLASLLGPDERFVEVASVLGPVLARRSDWAKRDLDVLRALAATDGVIDDGAARLAVTSRQFRRHAGEIATRLGIGLDSPLDQVRLGWALLLHRTSADQLPPPGDPAWTHHSPIADP